MRVPASILTLSALTGVYWLCSFFLDRDPAARPRELPYHILRHMERDARLRSVFHEQVARLSATIDPVIVDASTETRMQRQIRVEEPLAMEWSAEGYGAMGGAALLSVPPDGVEWNLDRPRGVAPTWLVEGRLRSPDAEHASVELWVDAGPEVPGDKRLHVAAIPPDLGPPARTPDLRASLSDQGWLELRLGLPGFALEDSGSITLWMRTDAPVIALDHLQVRAAPRIDHLLTGGQVQNLGNTESTSSLKRLVRRGAEQRLCLALEAPSSLEFETEVPRGAELELGWSAVAAAHDLGEAELTVALSREGSFEEMLRRIRVGRAHTGSFTDLRIDLAQYSGQRVRLQLRVSAAPDTRAPVVLLADPVLVGRDPQQRDLPHVLLVMAPPDLDLSRTLPRLGAEGITLSGFEPDPDPLLNHLQILSGQPSGEPRPYAGARPRIPYRQRTLAEELTNRGFRAFAASQEPQDPVLLQGFLRRWSAAGDDPVAALLAFLEQHASEPCFAALWLPRSDPQDALQSLLEELEQRELGDSTLIWVVPGRRGSGDPLPSFLLLPGREAAGRTSEGVLEPTDVGPTLLALLNEPPARYFVGRGLDRIALLTPDVEPATSPPNPIRINALRWERPLPQRVEVVVERGSDHAAGSR